MPPSTYPLSLHDALPIFRRCPSSSRAQALASFNRGRLIFAGTPSTSDGAVPHVPTLVFSASFHFIPVFSLMPVATMRIRRAERSEEHTSELQSLRHLVCPRLPTLFPYTTLFRSSGAVRVHPGPRPWRPSIAAG